MDANDIEILSRKAPEMYDLLVELFREDGDFSCPGCGAWCKSQCDEDCKAQALLREIERDKKDGRR